MTVHIADKPLIKQWCYNTMSFPSQIPCSYHQPNPNNQPTCNFQITKLACKQTLNTNTGEVRYLYILTVHVISRSNDVHWVCNWPKLTCSSESYDTVITACFLFLLWINEQVLRLWLRNYCDVKGEDMRLPLNYLVFTRYQWFLTDLSSFLWWASKPNCGLQTKYSGDPFCQ